MPLQRLRDYLDQHHVKYTVITHSRAFTAQEIAHAAHVPGQQLAKTVIVKLDGDMAMVVLPALWRVSFDLLSEVTNSDEVMLADEHEFASRFPGCDVGAMPPFGNLFDMDVYVDKSLADDDEIAFNAGSHVELIRMKYADFERLVQPAVVNLSWYVPA